MSFWSDFIGWFRPKPPAPTPPPSTTVAVGITVRGSDGKPPKPSTIGLHLDSVDAILYTTTTSEGRATFIIPRTRLFNGGNMSVAIPGYEIRLARVIMPPDEYNGIRVENDASMREVTVGAAYAVMDQEFIVQVEKPAILLLPLRPNGNVMETNDGRPWTGVGCTDFRLLARYIAGEDIRPILNQRLTLGFNELRVFLMCHGMFHLYPQEIPNYQAKLADFLALVATYGLRLELTVFVDATQVMPNTSQRDQFFSDVCYTVRALPHVKLELVNEVDQSINVIDTDRFMRPSGIVCCHGSKGVVDAAVTPVCVTPVWTYGVLHPKRDAEWPRYGHNIDEDVWIHLHVPGFINESCRPDQGRGPVLNDFFDAAANIALMGAGGTFHSNQGKDSVLFSSPELDCAKEWIRGAYCVPKEFQHGTYIAPHLTTPHRFPVAWSEGDSVRGHGRSLGNRACLSLPQMRTGYIPVGVDGWRVTSQNQSVVLCER